MHIYIYIYIYIYLIQKQKINNLVLQLGLLKNETKTFFNLAEYILFILVEGFFCFFVVLRLAIRF